MVSSEKGASQAALTWGGEGATVVPEDGMAAATLVLGATHRSALPVCLPHGKMVRSGGSPALGLLTLPLAACTSLAQM